MNKKEISTPNQEVIEFDDSRNWGVVDHFERIWAPYRMAYITGEAKPKDKSKENCPFCQAPAKTDEESLIIHRGKLAYVLLNLFPYNAGHLLICPYRHLADYTDASPKERYEISDLIANCMSMLKVSNNPEGFNIGVNQGQAGGAGISQHLHVHVIPRWIGDTNFFPLIAKTKSIAQLLGDTRDAFAKTWKKFIA